MTGWTKDASKAGRWKAPIPAGFNSSSIGGRMQMWRGDTRLTLARSPTLTYVHANSTFITFKGTDIASTYHDFANVHLVLYESWTASMHMLSHVDAANHKAYLASTYDSQWANQAAGARYYIENALEHLDQDDEYYVDHLSGSIFLQASTDPSTGPAIHLAGPVELLVLSGTPGTPLQGTSFSNVAFAHNVRAPQPRPSETAHRRRTHSHMLAVPTGCRGPRHRRRLGTVRRFHAEGDGAHHARTRD